MVILTVPADTETSSEITNLGRTSCQNIPTPGPTRAAPGGPRGKRLAAGAVGRNREAPPDGTPELRSVSNGALNLKTVADLERSPNPFRPRMVILTVAADTETNSEITKLGRASCQDIPTPGRFANLSENQRS